MTLLLNWYPEAEHGGFYAALVRGYYREAGIDVTILPGGPNTPVIQELATGRVTFGVANADNVLTARAKQAPVVAVMAALQTSPRCLIVHERAGIQGFDDLHDLTLAVTPAAAFTAYLRHKLPLENVQFVPYSGLEPFLRDEKFATQGYVFSEPFVAREKGGDPRVLMLSDLGFNPYTSLLVTTESEIRDHAELVRKMVAASVRGWQDYLADPDPTSAYLHEKNPAMDLASLAYGARTIAPLVRPPDEPSAEIGRMTLARWQTLLEQLVASKWLDSDKVDARGAFDDQFLPQQDAP